MHPRNTAVLGLALAMATGCASMRPHWLGGSSLGPPVDIPRAAVPMGEFVRGEVALQRNDMDTAIDAFEKAVAADPDTPMLRLRLATAFSKASMAVSMSLRWSATSPRTNSPMGTAATSRGGSGPPR